MKKIIIILITLLIILIFAGCSKTKEATPPPPQIIAWTSATQTGGKDSTIPTAGVDLVFANEIPSLTTDNFTVTGATKGALTGSGVNYNLAISNITIINGDTLGVAITNIPDTIVNPTNKGVVVYDVVPTPTIFNGDFSLGAQWEHQGWIASALDWDNAWLTFSIGDC